MHAYYYILYNSAYSVRDCSAIAHAWDMLVVRGQSRARVGRSTVRTTP